ncbi:MAG TPA: NlpC/P60 family protein [Solirubrobacteraceae bacterium]|nr:NlpC/P60 family protein [Solirubrobacteraceae bacterium]
MANHHGSRPRLRRAAVIVTVLAAASGVAVYTGASGAGAAPAPSINQVQAEVNSLQGKVDKIGEQYDAAGQQLSAAKARLAQVTKQSDRAQQQYDKASATLAAVAVAGYENQNRTSVIGLLTSGNPDAVLGQASLLLQIEGTHNEEAKQLLTFANELSTIKEQRQRTATGVAQVAAQYASQKSSMTKLLNKQKAMLDSLTAQQQAQVTAASVGGDTTSGNVTTTPIAYNGPTSSQAGKAVAYAYAQLGKPYVWGATGPDSFDCSGLMYAAWQSAGVTLPRTTYDEWASLPHIPLSDVQPGDLILYNGESHVAMYVGGGYIIDAPHTGAVVEKLPESTSWYADGADGAVRP